jgi:hypothetical protein
VAGETDGALKTRRGQGKVTISLSFFRDYVTFIETTCDVNSKATDPKLSPQIRGDLPQNAP